MPKLNPYYIKDITRLPETATVSYYNPETDENLTAEQWKELHSEVNPSEIRIINQGEVYQSWKINIDNPTYGPMPNFDNQALMIAGSHSVMSKIRTDFPKVAELLDWDRDLTLAFLKQENAFNAYLGQNAFNVPCSKTDDYSKTGPGAWTEYHKRIKEYVSEICSSTETIRRHYEELREAREVLAKYIWDEYYNVLPYWPSVGGVNERSFEAQKTHSYEYGSYYVVWNCLGWVYVKDERPASDIFKASFWGRPEIKLLLLNLYEMKRINDKCNRLGIEGAKREIKDYMGSSYRRIGWADF